jgi:EpsI family protein
MDRKTAFAWLGVLILSLPLAAAAWARSGDTPARQPLGSLPLWLGDWAGESKEFRNGAIETAGADGIVSRVYRAKGVEAHLTIAYWMRQQRGDQVYTPMNVAPSDRWRPLSRDTQPVVLTPDHGVPVNSVLFQHEGTRQREYVTYYYVQGGRAITSEQRGKLLTLVDLFHRRRSDAALIRVASPVERHDTQRLRDAHEDLLQALIPWTARVFAP